MVTIEDISTKVIVFFTTISLYFTCSGLKQNHSPTDHHLPRCPSCPPQRPRHSLFPLLPQTPPLPRLLHQNPKPPSLIHFQKQLQPVKGCLPMVTEKHLKCVAQFLTFVVLTKPLQSHEQVGNAFPQNSQVCFGSFNQQLYGDPKTGNASYFLRRLCNGTPALYPNLPTHLQLMGGQGRAERDCGRP